MGVKILYWGDSPTVDTGFGLVARNILKRLHKMGHEIVVLGVNGYGEPYDHEEHPYKIYPCQPGGHAQIYGLEKVWQIAEFERPDLLFMINDPWLIEDAWKRRPKNVPAMKTLAYYPTDAGPLKPKWAQLLSSFDAQVCYSNFAERIIIEANGNKRPKNLHQIYHGVDTETFHPINQQLARQALGLPPEAFVVGMVARNQFRKRFDLLVKAFADFAVDKPEARLYLHTALHDIGFDISDLARQFKIEEKLILTEGLTPAHGVSESRLNLIYNSFTVNALISLGDGFGLPVAESMATGCPQLVSGHSCLQELVEGHGGLTVKTASWILHTSGINTWGGVSDVKDITDKLQMLYDNPELRLKLSEDAYRFIHQPQFTWDYAANEFDKIIKTMFHILQEKEVDLNGITTHNKYLILSS